MISFSKISLSYVFLQVRTRTLRTGDGTHPGIHGDVWGWGDKDMSAEDRRDATVVNGKTQ